MGKGTPPRRRAGRGAGGRGRSERGAVRTRSFACPDDLWQEVEQFAQERGLGAPSVAARVLLRSGLSVERRVEELRAARDWQIEQAWADVQAIAGGDRTFGSWEEIEQAAERARLRIREREAAQGQATAGT